ncbi:MAG: hypothetical protein AAF639_17750 [Chloroflexota bacterium]
MSVTITKPIELSSYDVIQALRNFTENEWRDILRFMKTEMPAIWAQIPPIPIHLETPPLTEEGNQEALAAVNRMSGMFAIRDPELGRWLAESPDLSTYAEV